MTRDISGYFLGEELRHEEMDRDTACFMCFPAGWKKPYPMAQAQPKALISRQAISWNG